MDRLPSDVVTPRLVIRLWRPDDVEALRTAIEASIEHLRPWMPWVSLEPLSDGVRSQWILAGLAEWEEGGDAVYGAFHGSVVVGGCGLHRRQGPDTLHIGYWIHVDHVRKGYAAELARGLTGAAFGVDGIERVEIHHDKANVASGAIPRSLGFARGPDAPDQRDAPGEVGIDCTWSTSRAEWAARDRRRR